nr:MAG TPA: hypothetical protein [Bacteriophage sp.]
MFISSVWSRSYLITLYNSNLSYLSKGDNNPLARA